MQTKSICFQIFNAAIFIYTHTHTSITQIRKKEMGTERVRKESGTYTYSRQTDSYEILEKY